MQGSLFITIEGGEGAGKSTLLNKLEHFFLEKGRSVMTTREPGGTSFGEAVRQWLLHRDPKMKIGSCAELLLFLAARVQHIEEVIEPALREGKIVICDRFNDSTIAYQGVGRGLGIEVVDKLCNLVCDGVMPNITLYLDVPPDVGLKRAASSRAQDHIEGETIEFHQRIREAFHNIAKQDPSRFHILDATQPLDAVYQQATTLLNKLLP